MIVVRILAGLFVLWGVVTMVLFIVDTQFRNR